MSKRRDCPDCEGRDTIACGGCGGSGGHEDRRPCSECGGRGEVVCEHENAPEQPDTNSCRTCYGSGGGPERFRCQTCGGSGKRQVWAGSRSWDYDSPALQYWGWEK